MGIANCNETCTNREIIIQEEVLDKNKFELIIQEIVDEFSKIYEKSYQQEIVLKNFKISIAQFKISNQYFKKQNLIKEHKGIYEDIIFSPNSKSIKYLDKEIRRRKLINDEEIKRWEQLQFVDYQKLYGNVNLSILSFDFKIQDMKLSGGFFNLNLLVLLEKLLKYQSVQRRFMENLLISNNFLQVKLFYNGKLKSVVLDNFLPCLENKPHFEIDKKYMWLLFLEKSIAKINRSYCNCTRLMSNELFSFVSEAPFKKLIHEDSKEFFLMKYIAKMLKSNYIVMAEFSNSDLEILIDTFYLTFYVEKIFSFDEKTYLKIFSPKKTDENIKRLLNSEKNERLINKYLSNSEIISNNYVIVQWESYFHNFSSTIIGFVKDNYFYNYKKVEIKDSRYYLCRFKTIKQTHLFLSLQHKQKNHFIKVNNYDYPLSRIIIFQMIKNKNENKSVSSKNEGEEISKDNSSYQFQYLSSIFDKSEKLSIELKVGEGDFYVLFKCYVDFPIKSVLSTYSDQVIEIDDKIENNSFFTSKDHSTFNGFNSLFDSYLDKFNERKKTNSFLIEKFLFNDNIGYSFIRITNFLQNQLMIMNLQYECNGMRVIYNDKVVKRSSREVIYSESTNLNSKDSLEIMHIQPNTSELILFEWEKSLSDISILIRPNVKFQNLYYFNNSLISRDFVRKSINERVFYYEIPFKNGIFIVFINRSKKNYNLKVTLSDLVNAYLDYPKMEDCFSNIVKLRLNRLCRDYLHLSILNSEEIKYKISLNLEEV